jgi:8-oxo-dGTP pyrophosphatase MutT (NUDIX family)
MKNIVCINCDKLGHMFRNCKKPIVSYGVLAYKKDKINDEIKFLLIQRKDTIGYIDLVRGKINKNFSLESNYKVLMEEMTPDERKRLSTVPFDKLWDDLWCNHSSKTYINEYKKSKINFFKVDIPYMAENTESRWENQEFCIPKGRRNNKESNMKCGIREFCEETGYTRNEIYVDYQTPVVQETFLGGNGVMYKHVYYLTEILTTREPVLDPTNHLQAGEVKTIKWMNFKDSVNSFRGYDYSKRTVMYQALKHIKNQTLA